MHRFFFVAVGVACLSVAACDRARPTSVGNLVNTDLRVDDKTEIGQQLYDGPYRPAKAGDRSAEPITIPLANVLVLDKLDVSAKVDGTIWIIGIETNPADVAARKLPDEDLFTHPRSKKLYRRLKPGDDITRDQVVVLMDDARAYNDYQTADIALKVAKNDAIAAHETVIKLSEIADRTREGKSAVAPVELLQAEASVIKYKGDEVKAQGAVTKAVTDVDKANLVVDMHTLKSDIAGRVQVVLKNRGEGVKAQEPILTIQRFDRMRAIGNLPQEYKALVRPGDEVTIEAPADVPAELGKTFTQHTTSRPITAVAAGVANGKPVIVSAGDDGEVHVWDRDLKVLASWPQPAGVRALAVTRPGAEQALAVVGSDTGVAKLYDLANPGPNAIRELDGRHEGGVAAAAFSPDGKYCVTADERNLYLWDVATGKKKYAFGSREHHSPITDVRFTPQGRVISVGKEPSVRVWVVGDKDARVERRLNARVGDVAALGVTDDGSRMLLDAAKTQLDVIHLQDGRKERPLIGAGEAGRFSTFAVWSPERTKDGDDRLIATTGGTEGVVQVWRAPTEQDRGIEVARLICRDLTAATCVAFSPQAENGFIVVGTRRGFVHLWNRADAPTQPKATVTNVGSMIDSSGKTVEMLVEFDNPKVGETGYLFRPGSSVTLVVRPKK